MASEPDWHLFDAEAGLEVRQATPEGEANRWEVRRLDSDDEPVGDVVVLDDDEFEQLRAEGPNPKGLD